VVKISFVLPEEHQPIALELPWFMPEKFVIVKSVGIDVV
jgi:hypothetical protein